MDNEENIEDTFSIPINYIKNTSELFMLRVTDKNMIDIGMLVRDLAILEKTCSADNKEFVEALTKNKSILARFFEVNTLIKLKTENKTIALIIVSNCEIIGKLIDNIENKSSGIIWSFINYLFASYIPYATLFLIIYSYSFLTLVYLYTL